MTNSKQYFTELEILERTREHLENRTSDETVEITDLSFDVAARDYYIVYTHEAIEVLEEYGTWEAIQKVRDYELQEFGKVATDLGSPEDVANVLWLIVTEETLYSLNLENATVQEALEFVNSIIDGILEECDAWHNENDKEEECLDYGEVTNKYVQEVLESSEYAYIFEGVLNDEYVGKLDNEGCLHYGYAYYITTITPVNEYQSKQTIFFTNNYETVKYQLKIKSSFYQIDDVEEHITFF